MGGSTARLKEAEEHNKRLKGNEKYFLEQFRKSEYGLLDRCYYGMMVSFLV